MSGIADSNISVVNNVFIKQMVFPLVGYRVVTHAHVYDHQTLLAVGAVRMTVDGVSTEYQAPAILIIQAGKHHGIEALKDGTVAYCIHAMTGEEDLVQGIPNESLAHIA